MTNKASIVFYGKERSGHANIWTHQHGEKRNVLLFQYKIGYSNCKELFRAAPLRFFGIHVLFLSLIFAQSSLASNHKVYGTAPLY